MIGVGVAQQVEQPVEEGQTIAASEPEACSVRT